MDRRVDQPTPQVPEQPRAKGRIRGRHATAPNRLSLLGLDEHERRAIRNLVRALQAGKKRAQA